MALKDWKKTKETKTEIIFQNKKDKKFLVHIVRLYPSLKWNIESEYTPYAKGDFMKYDLSKSQALKFAKAYMRKH